MEDGFQESKLEASLKRAFVDKKAKTLIADYETMGNLFLMKSLSLGLKKGLISQREPIDGDKILGEGQQCYVVIYHLTEQGKKYFGVSE